MNATDATNPPGGLVLSDLHLFSPRSSGEACLESIRKELLSARVIVLNGDTFDFRWSTLFNEDASIRAALEWIGKFVSDHPQADVHLVIGNHDCLASFTSRLDDFAAVTPRFQWHGTSLRLGENLFVHGDCTHRRMDSQGLSDYRRPWEHDRPRHPALGRGYRLADRLGITWICHHVHFSRRKTIRHLMWYLDQSHQGWRETTRNCYFGHTHLPFSGFGDESIRFHNTGSAIGVSSFSPLSFHLEDSRESPIR